MEEKRRMRKTMQSEYYRETERVSALSTELQLLKSQTAAELNISPEVLNRVIAKKIAEFEDAKRNQTLVKLKFDLAEAELNEEITKSLAKSRAEKKTADDEAIRLIALAAPPIRRDTTSMFDVTAFCVKDLNAFTPSGIDFGRTGSVGARIFYHKGNVKERWLFKPTDWIEAYASVVNKFVLGIHAQTACFAQSETETKNVGAIIKLEPSFQSLRDYYRPVEGVLSRPWIPIKYGLAGIIVMAILLMEHDLGGLGSDAPNVGIIARNGVLQYFRIDNGQSLDFTAGGPGSPKARYFDLKQLKNPTVDMPFFELASLGKFMTPVDLIELSVAARRIAQIPRTHGELLIKILNEAENQLKALPKYPRAGLIPNQNATFRRTILDRFNELQDVFDQH